MAFFTTAITTLKTLVCAIGAGLAAWGVINLLEGYGTTGKCKFSKGTLMAFFTTAITTLKTLVCAIGAGLAAWGVINLLEGYGTDNPGAKSQGIKQLMAN